MTAHRLCFIGDSLIEYHNWQASFPGQEVVNLGVAGETAPELLARLRSLSGSLSDHGVKFGSSTLPPNCNRVHGSSYRPQAVVVMTGTNDLLMGADFLPYMETIVTTLRTLWPEACLLVNGLMPMDLSWLPSNLIPRTNARLEELALRHKIGYLDGCRIMPSPPAGPPCFLDDGVHLSPHGYALWSAAIENHLRQSGCM